MKAAGGGAGVSAPVASSLDDSPSKKQSSSLSQPRGDPLLLLRISTRTPSKPDETARSTLASPQARRVPLRRTRPGARSSTLMTAGEPSASVLHDFFFFEINFEREKKEM